MYKPATKRVISKRDVKWHGIYGANTANDPTISDIYEGTEQKKTIRENAIKDK